MNRPAETWRLGLAEALAGFASGRLDRGAHLAACRARTRAVEPLIHAFACLAPEPGGNPGHLPLSGIAVGVKDLFDTADLPTAYGAQTHQGHRPARDAELIARLRALGAHVAGKTVTTEFAWRQPGPTRNPWGLGRTPGGSSSGSAAAVAAGSVPLAIGTQTYGSVIRPAAFCGIVGFKPGRGVLPLAGAHPLSPSLDHAGLFARNAGDVAHVHALLTGTPAATPQRPERLILDLAGLEDRLSPEQHAVMESAARAFRTAGVAVEQAPSGPDHARLRALADIILAGEAARIFAPLLAAQPGRISHHIADLVARGMAQPAGALEAALAEAADRSAAGARLGTAIVLTAPALGPAPPLAEGTGDPAAATGWTVLGLPAITLPWALSADGLPLGLQLVAAPGAEARLLAAAAWCEGLRPAPGFPDLPAEEARPAP